MKKQIGIFGSTGSIGLNSVSILTTFLKDKFEVSILSCESNIKALASQVNLLKPKAVYIANSQMLQEFKKSINNTKLAILSSINEVKDFLNNNKLHTCIIGTSGFAGFQHTLVAIEHSKKICLANKECIVAGWDLINSQAKIFNTEIIPVDSEHNSIFRLLQIVNYDIKKINSITLTASGGSLLNTPIDKLEAISIKDVLKHPNWQMGNKITVDSATMGNKSLELIEACRIFDLKEKHINITIHPQSIIHGLIELKDNSSVAFLSEPNMQLHISHAIVYPEENATQCVKPLNFEKLSSLNFISLDYNRFPLLKLAREISYNKLLCIVFNAANEKSVDLFLKQKISFLDISKNVYNAVEYFSSFNQELTSFEEIRAFHDEVCKKVENSITISF